MDQDQWTIIENTHEAIIDQETYDKVQRSRSGIRRYPDGWGETHPLSGLLYCADCGSVMYIHQVNNGKRIPQFTCANYSKLPVGSRCPTQHRVNGDHLMGLIRKYRDFEELTAPMLIELVDRILVHERDIKGCPDSPQTIEIYFNFLGKLELLGSDAEPTPEEIEMEQKKAAARARRREQYRHRVESGKAAEYYERTKAARKAKMDAEKEACRAEDREKGIYYFPNGPKTKKQEGDNDESIADVVKDTGIVNAAAV